MKLTRAQALRSMVGLFGVLFASLKQAYPQSFTMTGLGISFGDPVPDSDLSTCPNVTSLDGPFVTMTEDCTLPDGSVRSAPNFLGHRRYIPNTASTVMDIGAFKSFTFKNGNESITITRAEMWEALNGR